MENLIDFKTGPIPLSGSRRCKFPYDKVLNSLKVLNSELSIIFDEKEVTYSNMKYLRQMAEKRDMGTIKSAKHKDATGAKKIHVWINGV